MKAPGRFISVMLSYLFLTATTVFASSFHDGAGEVPESASEAWNATVFLEARFVGKDPWHYVSSTGTGTVVAQDSRGETLLIATSAHVVVAHGSAGVIRARFQRSSGTVSARARLLWSDTRMDLALLEARRPRGAQVSAARLTRTLPAPPYQVLAIGFPDLALEPGASHRGRRIKVFSTGSLLEAPESFEADYYALASTEASGRLDPGGVLIHSAALLPGSSGGPLINAEGRVIGINAGSLARDSKCLVRATGEGPRCVHLAIPMDVLLGRIADWTAKVIPLR